MFWIGVAIAVIMSIAEIGVLSAQDYDYSFGTPRKRARVYTEWGIGVGGVYTGVGSLTTEEVRLKPRFGIQGHIDMAVCFGRNFALETEIAYEGGSMDVATESMEHRVKTRTMDIPLLLSLRFVGGRIRLSAGPQFTVMSRAEYTDNGEKMLFGPVSPTWNIAAGIGVGLSRHFIFEARYIHALSTTSNQFGGKENSPGVEFGMRPYRISAGIAIIF